MQKRARVMALFLLTACGGTPAASGDGGLADAPPAASCEGAANGSPCAAALPSICLSGACVASRCGDGIVDPRAEVCDDGNDTGGDGCERTCRTSCDTPECQASECRPCSTSADCAGGSCVRYGESDVAWCSIACESDSDCAGLPGFTRCGGGYCAHDSVVSACSPDGTRTQFLDRCERVLAEEPCEADDRCVPLATGGHTCRALAPAPACARCERDAQCDSGSCLFYEDYPDAGFCSTTCTSDADCAGLAGLTRCSMGWCVHTGFTQECTGTQTYALVDSCGLVLASGACENSDRCGVEAEEVYCIATNRPECAPCETGADCAGGSCIGYGDGTTLCTRRCTTSADCAGSPNGLTVCTSGGFCDEPGPMSSCSADGTQVEHTDGCGNVRPPTTCTSPEQCVVGASGVASCALPGSCIGTPSSCSGRGDSSSCRAVSGCSWENTCSGSAQSCYSFYGSASCRRQDGCDYEGLYPNGDCRGGATRCSYFWSESSCERQTGCRWESECDGTPQACSTFGDPARCAAQPGCRWG